MCPKLELSGGHHPPQGSRFGKWGVFRQSGAARPTRGRVDWRRGDSTRTLERFSVEMHALGQQGARMERIRVFQNKSAATDERLQLNIPEIKRLRSLLEI